MSMELHNIKKKEVLWILEKQREKSVTITRLLVSERLVILDLIEKCI